LANSRVTLYENGDNTATVGIPLYESKNSSSAHVGAAPTAAAAAFSGVLNAQRTGAQPASSGDVGRQLTCAISSSLL
jgi:hypothetical protein